MIAHAKVLDQHNDHDSNCFVLHSQVYAFTTFSNSYSQTAILSFAGNPGYILSHVETFILFSLGQLQEKNYYYADHVS